MMRTLMWPLWWFTVTLTVGIGGLLAWLPTGTTLFDAVDTDDYMLSAGGYAATAIVLLFAATALEGFGGPRNARRLSVGFAALYSFLAVRATVLLSHAPLGPGLHSATEGAIRALLAPWALFLVVAGALAWVRLVREARRTTAPVVPARTATLA